MPITWESRILSTLYGTKKIQPLLINTSSLHYFSECDGLMRINHGLIFGYISLYNMAYAPIKEMHDYLTTTQ